MQRIRRIEFGEMLRDNLIGLVTYNPRGTGVPGQDLTLGIKHKNGIVGDAFYQQPEALLTLIRAILRTFY